MKITYQKNGAYIICGNHVHGLDAPCLVLATKRKINFMAKRELFKNPILKWLGKAFDVIPVNRNEGDMEALKKSFKVLDKGEILGLFPEGTRKGLEKQEEVKNGAAFMAARTGTPIIPVGIQGSFIPFTKVKLNYGKPIDVSEYKSKKPDKEVLEKITKMVMDEVIRLTNEQL